MTSERIKEIQQTTAYPDSTSVMLALKQVWNECAKDMDGEMTNLMQLLVDKWNADVKSGDPERITLGEVLALYRKSLTPTVKPEKD